MTEHPFVVDPQRFLQFTTDAVELSSPDDVARIQELVRELLLAAPEPTSRELVPHVAEHFSHVFPAVVADDRLREPLNRLAVAYAQRVAPEVLGDAGPDADLSPQAVGPADTGEPGGDTDREAPIQYAFPWGPAALGAAAAVIVGYYTLEAIASYCGNVHPAKGQSADVHC